MSKQQGSFQPPFQLAEEWGEIKSLREECPGVYYLATASDLSTICREFYAVMPDAIPSIISEEAASYGRQAGNVLLFEYEVENSGWHLVAFEITRYRVKQGLPLDRFDSLYCEAIFAAERYPQYFGGMIPPRDTPCGLTTRVKEVCNGVYFLDTMQCQWVLAVAYPIWESSFSDFVKGIGEFCKTDRGMGEMEAQYLFFRRDRCAPAIYELLTLPEYQGLMRFIHSRACLETQLFQQFPEYAVWNNQSEMSGCGRGDILDNLLAMLGCQVEPSDSDDGEEATARRLENCVHFWPDLLQQELLRLPK